ncbi:putative serine carboxypeptidase CPVL [Dermacentor variabilis]|uniref:putative serine carboxypeptidase CPVL n=1 Tax=Dermacentor variabilis TaxID=34621 RepID=UPI003F5AFC2D
MKFYAGTLLFLIPTLALARCKATGQTKEHDDSDQQRLVFDDDLLLPATNDNIYQSKLNEMRNRSRVNLPAPCANLEAYSGFIPVDDNKNSTYLFFLHIKSQVDADKKPLLLWLQGDPGKSALYSQFLENGPLGIDASGSLYRRSHSLLNQFNIIYLDQPAGSGYSFDRKSQYPSTLEQVSTHAIKFLRRFLRIYSEYKGREFFIAGESYGARSAIGLAQRMLAQPQKVSLSLKGVMLGNGFVFPLLEIINSADYLYCSGLLDEQGRSRFDQEFQKIEYMIKAQNFTQAAALLSQTVLNIHPGGKKTLFEELTGFQHHGSITNPLRAKEFGKYVEYANREHFKKLIHVGTSRILDATSYDVTSKLVIGDFFVDVTPTLVDVLNKAYVLFYTAQLDAIFPATNMERCFAKLQWRGSEMFKEAVRKPWYRTGSPYKVPMGYEKTAGAVMYNSVLFGGHFISSDQSMAVRDMYNRFLKFTSKPAPPVPGQKCGSSKKSC